MVHRSQWDGLVSATRHPDTVQAGPSTYPRWGSKVNHRYPARVWTEEAACLCPAPWRCLVWGCCRCNAGADAGGRPRRRAGWGAAAGGRVEAAAACQAKRAGSPQSASVQPRTSGPCYWLSCRRGRSGTQGPWETELCRHPYVNHCNPQTTCANAWSSPCLAAAGTRTRSRQRQQSYAPFKVKEPGPQLWDDHLPAMRTWLIHKRHLSVLDAQAHEAVIVTITQRQVTTASRNAQLIRFSIASPHRLYKDVTWRSAFPRDPTRLDMRD